MAQENMADRVTNQQLYEAIEHLNQKIDVRILRLETKVDANTGWRNQITGKLTIMFVLIGVGVNWLWDVFSPKFK